MHFLNSSPTKSLGQAQAVGVRRPWSPRRHDGRRGTVLGRTAGSREFSWPQPSCFLTEPDVRSPRQSPVAVDTSSCPGQIDLKDEEQDEEMRSQDKKMRHTHRCTSCLAVLCWSPLPTPSPLIQLWVFLSDF